LWEESLIRFTKELGKQQLDQLARLERTHGVRLGTISDRLQEKFVKPLALDRLCALIEPAMSEARSGGGGAFDGLRKELAAYTATPVGVGLDVPFWLRRMEMEVARVQATQTTVATLAEHFFRVPRQVLDYDDLVRQLQEWERPALPQ
jgi:DNA-binding response OmpR family regulator